MSDNLLRMEEVAQRLGIKRPTVYDLIRRGNLQPVMVSRSWRIPESVLDAYIERLKDTAQEEALHGNAKED